MLGTFRKHLPLTTKTILITWFVRFIPQKYDWNSAAGNLMSGSAKIIVAGNMGATIMAI